jgi:hypothetical protein
MLLSSAGLVEISRSRVGNGFKFNGGSEKRDTRDFLVGFSRLRLIARTKGRSAIDFNGVMVFS